MNDRDFKENMTVNYSYIKVNQNNIDDFEQWKPRFTPLKSSPTDHAFGILGDEKPCGLVIMREEGGALAIRHMGMSIETGVEKVCVKIFNQLWKYAQKRGFKELVYRYSGNGSGLNEDVLRRAGFKNIYEDSRVYEIKAATVARLLCDSKFAAVMRKQCVRILDEGICRRFAEAGSGMTDFFKELYPNPSLSFMTLNDNGLPGSSVVISELSDGSPYLADFAYEENKERDFAGLVYMSFGAVLMEIQPEGLFYIAAVKSRFKKFAQGLFEPVEEGISEQIVYRASRPVAQKG